MSEFSDRVRHLATGQMFAPEELDEFLTAHCAAVEAAALREAINGIDRCEAFSQNFEGPYHIDKELAMKNVLNLIRPDAALALDRMLADARREMREAAAGLCERHDQMLLNNFNVAKDELPLEQQIRALPLDASAAPPLETKR